MRGWFWGELQYGYELISWDFSSLKSNFYLFSLIFRNSPNWALLTVDDTDLLYVDVCVRHNTEKYRSNECSLFSGKSIISLTLPALDGHALWRTGAIVRAGWYLWVTSCRGALVAVTPMD